MNINCKTSLFIEKAYKKHGNKFDYSLTNYVGAKSPITIICSNNHTFTQSPNDHLNGHGCKICSGWGVIKSNPDEFIKRAKGIHGDLYNYNKSLYVEHDSPLIIMCKIHGDFKQSPKSHLIKKYGCPKCGHIVKADKLRWSLNKFINESNLIHRNKYNYLKFKYTSFSVKSEIICKKHGSFHQSPKDHIIQMQGCPKCSLSKGENLIQYYLIDNDIEYIFQKTFDDCINTLTKRKLKFDFFIPSINTCIEFDGKQHFEENPRFKGTLSSIQYRDELKNNYCINNQINLVRIKYLDIKEINHILNKIFKN
jgi:hypothetical protein